MQQLMLLHQCTSYCKSKCTLRGTWYLQKFHPLSVLAFNIPQSQDQKKTTWTLLKEHFSPCGRILFIKIVESRLDPHILEAMITFGDTESARQALDMNNSYLNERIITVRRALDVSADHLRDLPSTTWGIGTPVSALGDSAHSLGESISAIGNKMNTLDEYYHISERASAVKEGIREIDQEYQISETASAVASKATSEGKRIISNVSEQVGIPQATETVKTKAHEVTEQIPPTITETVHEIGNLLSSAYEAVVNFVSPSSETTSEQNVPQAGEEPQPST